MLGFMVAMLVLIIVVTFVSLFAAMHYAKEDSARGFGIVYDPDTEEMVVPDALKEIRDVNL